MPRLSLSLLGSFQAALDGRPITSIESDRGRALLAYLVVEADRPHRRDKLIGLLWPDWPESSALTNLRNALSNLRKAIGDREAAAPVLLVDRETIQFNPAGNAWVDVLAFQTLTAPKQPAERLAEGIALYRGSFLDGFSLKDSAAFEEWLTATRDQLERLGLTALARLAEQHESARDLAKACEVAWRAVDLAPWQEESHRRLMRLLALSGQRSAALAQFETCRHLLQRELRVEPAAETTRLYEQIRDGVVASGDAEGQRSSGERVPFPSAPLHNLPTWLMPCIGREELLTEVATRLIDPGCRLLTLVGPGGSGKTRLAVEAAAREASAFAHGVCFVPLISAASAESLASTIAHSLGLHTAAQADPRQQVTDYLRAKQLLMVLDNFEHLTGAAPLVGQLLTDAPDLKALVTSRVALQIQGEQRLPISGLLYPAETPARPLDPYQYSSLRLFVQAARQVAPAFNPSADDLTQVAAICRLVGGLPLGILLAAAWMRLLSPRELVEQLAGRSLDLLDGQWQDLPDRQRSVRAVFDQSWRLLNEQERQAFAQLAVFRGGFTYSAAQGVGGVTLHTLLRLVNCSLLERTPSGRYAAHELLRQYAEQKLDADPAGRETACARHAAHYMGALPRWAAALKGPGQTDALNEMDAEIANVQAAWAWTVRRGAAEQLAEGTEGLGLYYTWRSFSQAGEMAVHAAADALAPGSHPQPAPVLLTKAGLLAWRIFLAAEFRHLELVAELLPQITALLDEAAHGGEDVRRTRAFALQVSEGPRRGVLTVHWGVNRLQPGELAQQDLLLTSLGLYRALNDLWGAANALYSLGLQAWAHGQGDEAIRRHEESLAIRRRLGAPREILDSLLQLSWALPYGQPTRVEALQREGIALARSLGDPVMLAWALSRLAMIAQNRGEGLTAALLLAEEGSAIYSGLGDRQRQANVVWTSGQLHLALGNYPQARAALQQSRELFRATGDIGSEGMALANLGGVALSQGEPAEAYRLIEAGIAALTEGAFWGMVPNAYGRLSVAALQLGDRDLARRHLVIALRTAARQTPRNVVYALPGAMLLALAEGHAELAVELHTLALRYPVIANGVYLRDLIDEPVAAAAASLPPAVVAAAEQRGRERDYRSTLEALLAEWGG